jgi:hypothetical protein
MNEKIGSTGLRRVKIVREGLTKYCLDQWPVSYYPWPVRIGIVFFRLLGTPGSTIFDVVVPLDPEPASLELFRLAEAPMKGGSPLVDAVRYGLGVLHESTRQEKRMKLIGDGGNDGEEIGACEQEVRSAGIPIDSIELSDTSSENMRRISSFSHGTYYQVKTIHEFLEAVSR